MADSKKLIQKVAREIEASGTTSQTAAGRNSAAAESATEQATLDARIDATNQVFALFRLNYHNQFYAAYPDSEQLNQVKKLWLEALRDFPIEQVLRGARHAIESSEYLPTLNKMLECCRDSLSPYGLPDARSAYREACRAGTPRSAQAWSHPAVYLAGRDTDWFVLSTEPEKRTWPIFREAYQHWCGRVMAGDELSVPNPAALHESPSDSSSKEQALAELAKIRATLKNPVADK